MSTVVKGQREYIRNADNTRLAGSLPSSVLAASAAGTITVGAPIVADVAGTHEGERLLSAGILPVDIPIPAPLAAQLDFEGDEKEGMFYLSSEPVIGRQGDLRREAIGDKESTLITFTDETGRVFERDQAGTVDVVVVDYRGDVLEQVDDPEGLSCALDFLASETDMGPDYQQHCDALTSFYEHGVAGEEDMLNAVGHLVYLQGEIDDDVDMGPWSASPEVLRDAFSALSNSLPKSFIRRFGMEEYGRSYAETDILLADRDANPFL
jgi:hypothetical protein